MSLGDEHSATFLIKHSCLLDHQTSNECETPLHLLSSLNPMELSSDMMDGMCRVTQLILESGGDTSKKDRHGNTCLHRAILTENMMVFEELLKAKFLPLDERNKEDHVPLWLALQQAEQKRKCGIRNSIESKYEWIVKVLIFIRKHSRVYSFIVVRVSMRLIL